MVFVCPNYNLVLTEDFYPLPLASQSVKIKSQWNVTRDAEFLTLATMHSSLKGNAFINSKEFLKLDSK